MLNNLLQEQVVCIIYQECEIDKILAIEPIEYLGLETKQ